jgi:hypothetical protein
MVTRETTLDIVRFCAIECELQVSGELSVYNMVNAWDVARNECMLNIAEGIEGVTEAQILRLGYLVEPGKNQRGFRQCPVWVGRSLKIAWDLIPSALYGICQSFEDVDPAEWFKEYEEIHPFVDGNGRTGAILYNWLNGSLLTPKWPPNFWKDSRRYEGHGAGHL